MPTLFCSLKLSKFINLKTKLPSVSLNNWNGHLFYLEKRKCLAFVHKETFYSFVLFDILKKDLTNFKELFINGFLNQLNTDHLLTNELKDFILKDLETFELSVTDGDASTIGFLNDCIKRLTWERNGLPPTIEQAKKYTQNYYNRNPIGVKKFIKAIALMTAYLKKYD
jgi:hypothetical protein